MYTPMLQPMASMVPVTVPPICEAVRLMPSRRKPVAVQSGRTSKLVQSKRSSPSAPNTMRTSTYSLAAIVTVFVLLFTQVYGYSPSVTRGL